MAGTSNRTARVLTRAVLLGAVLAGLFLMHGAPGAASGGCHGGMAVSVTSQHHAMDQPVSGKPTGGLCLATPIRSGFDLLPVGVLVSVVTGLLIVAVGFVVSRPTDRGPPGGRALLAQVCVSRT
jgi:hypothetical protein